MKKITFKTSYNSQQDGGFSLIEVAVGIIILGLLIGGLFQAYSIYIKQKTADANFESHDKITQALALYLQENGAFPCPADPTLTPGNANFGIEMVNTATTPETCASYKKGGVAIGTVPVFDLNIPFTQISDAYGNKITYAVTEVLTDPDSYDSSRLIEVETSSGATQNVQFVLVSHGADKKGAYLRLAGAQGYPCTGSDDPNHTSDYKNCDWTIASTSAAEAVKFADYDISTHTNPADDNHFDDMLTYSLAMGESTLWGMARNGSDGLNVVNRDIARVGIGTDSPAARLHVAGGDLIVEATGPAGATTGGNVDVGKNVTAGGDVKANQNINAKQIIKSPVFYYE